MEFQFEGEARVFCSNCSLSTFLIKANGRHLAFGNNSSGQLGVGDCENRNSPTAVQSLQEADIQMVSSGDRHTLILTKDDHNIYVCGSNGSGQLGAGFSTGEQRTTPILLPFFTDKDIVQVRAGAFSSYCLSSDGSLYSFGWNNYGQLGIGNGENKTTPQLVQFPGDVKIERISAGWEHMAALTSNGRVYSCGHNGFGQLGRGGEYEFPAKVEELEGKRAKEVICGHNTTFVVVEKDEIYSFGANGYGSLGIGTASDQHRPQRISFFDTQPIRVLSVGSTHSFAILENRDIYAFGTNEIGRLLLEGNTNRLTPTKVDISVMEGEKIIDVKCGNRYTLVVTESGKCYGVGYRDAFSTSKDVLSPKLVAENVLVAPRQVQYPFPPPPPVSSSQQRILQYILDENFSDTVTGITDYTIEVKNKIREITKIHLDRDFLRLRCPQLDISADERSSQVLLESFFTPRMKETLIVALYVGKTESAQGMRMEEMMGLHQFLTKCPLSERLRVAIEVYLRREVDLSLKVALDVVIEAFEIGNEELVEYPLAVVSENFTDASDYLYEVKDKLPCDILTLVKAKKPKKRPLPSFEEIEEPNPKDIISALYEEAFKGEGGEIGIKFEEEVVMRAHRFILGSNSPYFRNILVEDPTTTSIKLLKHLKKAFPPFLRYMYTGEVGEEPLDSLVMLPAVKFFANEPYTENEEEEELDEFDEQLRLFCKAKASNIRISLENCVDVIIATREQGLDELKEEAMLFAARNQRALEDQLDALDSDLGYQILKKTCKFQGREIAGLRYLLSTFTTEEMK